MQHYYYYYYYYDQGGDQLNQLAPRVDERSLCEPCERARTIYQTVPSLTSTQPRPQVELIATLTTIKHEYAAATGADVNRLLWDRAYKQQHRPALTIFFQDQVRQRPQLPEEHFLNVLYGAADVDVLPVTGMRDEAPVATLSHLVLDSRLLEVCIKATKETRWVRRGCQGSDDDGDDNKDNKDNKDSNNGKLNLTVLGYRSSLVFNNDITGNDAAKIFTANYLLPFFYVDLDRLASIVRPIPDFPCPGIEFRHVLDISQQRSGLALCTSQLHTCITGDWAKADVVACCDAGGFVYASALAARVDVPLALIRQAGKVPPRTVSVTKSTSHISSSTSNNSREKRIEINRDSVPRGASVVVVDDVLATGKTLCMTEFPVHRGRELLRRHGFGGVNIQNLLVFGDA